MQRVFITGCAKSGTTLLRRLFFSFAGMGIIREEVSLDNFINLEDKKDGIHTLVGKRSAGTIYSNVLPDGFLADQVQKIDETGVKVVNIVRDGRDVITNGYVWVNRYIAAIRQTVEFEKQIVHQIKFEDIIYHPEREQNKLAEVLGLTIAYPWSDYPSFVREKDEASEVYKLYGLTDKKIIGNDFYKKSAPGLIGQFEDALAVNGYIEKPKPAKVKKIRKRKKDVVLKAPPAKVEVMGRVKNED